MVECFFSDPKKWGKHVWYILDMMIIRYDPSNEILQNHILMQFVSLMETIPCQNCREHYKNYISSSPIEEAFKTKISLAKWIYNLKSEINKRQKKKNITFHEYIILLKNTFDCNIYETDMKSKKIYSSI